jgi:acetyl esterase/lipase
MHQQWWAVAAVASLMANPGAALAQAAPEPADSFVYRSAAERPLRLYLFRPSGPAGTQPLPAVLLFHGGGWATGSPDWTYSAARQFAQWGLAAIPVQYRLAGGAITPADALADVCAAFEWVRGRAKTLGLSGRLIGYGVSAGGHLVSAASTVGCANADPGPEALLLLSPALDVGRDSWFVKLLQGRASASSLSPLEHIRSSTAPTSIVQGDKDVLTPLSGAERYCTRLRELGKPCELNVYPGLGHLLTRNLRDQENTFDPDPKARADGMERYRAFLRQLRLLPQ